MTTDSRAPPRRGTTAPWPSLSTWETYRTLYPAPLPLRSTTIRSKQAGRPARTLVIGAAVIRLRDLPSEPQPAVVVAQVVAEAVEAEAKAAAGTPAKASARTSARIPAPEMRLSL